MEKIEGKMANEGLMVCVGLERNERRSGKRWLLETWGLALGLFG